MITLREATWDDLGLLQYWDTQPHVIAADPDDDWDWPTELRRNPDWRLQLIAELEGKPIGMVQIIDPEKEDSHYWGKTIGPNKRAIDIWIGEAHLLGKGYGTQILKLALNLCFEDPKVTEVLVDPLVSNLKAINFYQKYEALLDPEWRNGRFSEAQLKAF